jgi:uncharacterized membrane protein YhhN
VLSLVAFAGVSAVHVGAKLVGSRRVDRATKAALLPLLALRLVAGPYPGRRAASLLTASLTAGWIGDLTIDRSFRTGLAAFLAGHLGWIALFSSAPHRRVAPWSVLAIPWLAAVLVAVRPGRSGTLFPAVAAYGAVLATMAATATLGNRRTTVGGILFVISDTLLALRRLTPWLRSPAWGAAVMASYTAAQALLVDGALDTGSMRPKRQSAR